MPYYMPPTKELSIKSSFTSTIWLIILFSNSFLLYFRYKKDSRSTNYHKNQKKKKQKRFSVSDLVEFLTSWFHFRVFYSLVN